VKQDTF